MENKLHINNYSVPDKTVKKSSYFRKRILPNSMLYLFILPAFVYILIFHYIPLYGLQIAFKEYSVGKGIWGSNWVGFKQFITFFNSIQFWNLIKNTIGIHVYQLLAGFPIPIILALMLNYCTSKTFRKFVQTISYAPHFISTVVMVGMILLFLSPRTGFVNQLIAMMGGEPIYFMGKPELFKSIYVWSGIWQNAGWASIIYIAALAAISPELHEAGIVDGASKLQRIWYIDIPGILPTAIILLILNFGHMMSVGFEKVFLMQNDIVLEKSEVISTYVYKVGLVGARYSYASAIGLINNIVNFILLLLVNKISRKLTETSLF